MAWEWLIVNCSLSPSLEKHVHVFLNFPLSWSLAHPYRVTRSFLFHWLALIWLLHVRSSVPSHCALLSCTSCSITTDLTGSVRLSMRLSLHCYTYKRIIWQHWVYSCNLFTGETKECRVACPKNLPHSHGCSWFCNASFFFFYSCQWGMPAVGAAVNPLTAMAL